MHEEHKQILKKYIKCYEAIQTLHENSIFDDEEKEVHEHNLLFNIIETMRIEIDEQEGE